MEEIQKINVRFPDILYKRMQTLVRRAQEMDPGYSINSYVIALVREDLDNRDSRAPALARSFMPPAAREWGEKFEAMGVMEVPAGAYRTGDVVQAKKLSAADLAAKFGIKTGATIEEVESGLPGSLGPDAEPVVGASENLTESPEETLARSFIKEFGHEAFNRGMKIPSFKRAKWPERFEMAREQKERGE